jgi:hypothetical protein
MSKKNTKQHSIAVGTDSYKTLETIQSYLSERLNAACEHCGRRGGGKASMKDAAETVLALGIKQFIADHDDIDIVKPALLVEEKDAEAEAAG